MILPVIADVDHVVVVHFVTCQILVLLEKITFVIEQDTSRAAVRFVNVGIDAIKVFVICLVVITLQHVILIAQIQPCPGAVGIEVVSLAVMERCERVGGWRSLDVLEPTVLVQDLPDCEEAVNVAAPS